MKTLFILFGKIKKFIIRHMKAVMIAIFTVCMGYSAYIFGNLTTKQLTAVQIKTDWIWFSLLILASILSIIYASILGNREDKERNSEHLKRMEYYDQQIINLSFNNPTPHEYSIPKEAVKKYNLIQKFILWLNKIFNIP